VAVGRDTYGSLKVLARDDRDGGYATIELFAVDSIDDGDASAGIACSVDGMAKTTWSLGSSRPD